VGEDDVHLVHLGMLQGGIRNQVVQVGSNF